MFDMYQKFVQALLAMLTKLGITQFQDKVLHGVAGVIVGVISMILPIGTILPIIIVLILAIGKEVLDVLYVGMYVNKLPFALAKERFDFFDLFVTLAGGFFGIAVAGIIF